MTSPVRLAFIGLGHHSFLLAKAASTCTSINIAGGYSIVADDMQRFAKEFACRSYQSFTELCADPDLDGAVIASPNDVHAEQAIALAHSGKHLFIEKPLCNTISEVDLVIDAAAQAGVLLAVGHQERRNQVYRRMKSMIDKGELGTVHAFEANHCGNLLKAWPQDDWRFETGRGTGPLLHKGIHKIDVLNYLFGRAECVSTVSKQIDFNPHMQETTITGITYADGIIGSLSTGFRYNNQTFNIYGELYSLFYSGYGNDLEIKNEKTWERQTIACPCTDLLKEELEEFALAIKGQAQIEVDGHIAREAILFAIAAADSADQGLPLTLTNVLETCCA